MREHIHPPMRRLGAFIDDLCWPLSFLLVCLKAYARYALAPCPRRVCLGAGMAPKPIPGQRQPWPHTHTHTHTHTHSHKSTPSFSMTHTCIDAYRACVCLGPGVHHRAQYLIEWVCLGPGVVSKTIPAAVAGSGGRCMACPRPKTKAVPLSFRPCTLTSKSRAKRTIDNRAAARACTTSAQDTAAEKPQLSS